MKRLSKFEMIWAIVFIAILMTLCNVLHAQTYRSYYNEYKVSIYTRLNTIRSEHGLKPVTVNKVLENKAERWLRRMLQTYSGHLVHENKNGTYEVLTAAQDPINAWMNSPGHRKILLNPTLKEVGFFSGGGFSCMKGF